MIRTRCLHRHLWKRPGRVKNEKCVPNGLFGYVHVEQHCCSSSKQFVPFLRELENRLSLWNGAQQQSSSRRPCTAVSNSGEAEACTCTQQHRHICTSLSLSLVASFLLTSSVMAHVSISGLCTTTMILSTYVLRRVPGTNHMYNRSSSIYSNTDYCCTRTSVQLQCMGVFYSTYCIQRCVVVP